MVHQPILTNTMVVITTINLLGCTGESTLLQLKKSDASYTPTTSNDMNFIILDACQDQPFIHNLDIMKDSSITFSTAPNSVAENDAGSNGVCNQHLSANIKLPGADVEVLFRKMRIGIPKENNATQQAQLTAPAQSETFCLQPVVEASKTIKRIINIGTF